MVSLKCCINTFLKWKGSPKIWVVGAFLVFYIYNLTSPIVAFCKDVGYPITPWLFPYFFSNSSTSLLLMLAFVLFCVTLRF